MANCIINRTQDLSSINSSISSLQSGKQDKLVSGTNIKTVNDNSLLGSGNVAVAPTSHASSATTYGLGTTDNYGHVKTINNLNQTSNQNGTALSAYQGKVLNDTKFNKTGGDLSASIRVIPSDTNAGGNVTLVENRYDLDTFPKSNAYGAGVYVVDNKSNSNQIALMRSHGTSNEHGLDLAVSATINGSKVSNSLSLIVNKDGTRKVTLDTTAWRTALDILRYSVSMTRVNPTVSGATITLNTPISSSHGKIHKSSQVVSLSINGSWDGNIPHNQIGTLPDAIYYPKEEISVNINPSVGSTNPYVTVTTDGKVMLGGYTAKEGTVNNVIRAQITWITT